MRHIWQGWLLNFPFCHVDGVQGQTDAAIVTHMQQACGYSDSQIALMG